MLSALRREEKDMKRKLLSFFLVVSLVVSALSAQTAGSGLKLSADGTLILPVQTRFSIQYTSGYKVLTVSSPWPGATKSYTYVLYPRAGARPQGVKADRFIATPISKAVSFSTTYLPVLDNLNVLGSLAGVDDISYVYNPKIRQLISDAKVVQTTKNYSPDIERLISLAPDVIFTFGVGNEWDTHPKMEEAGLPVVILGDWNEANPLARAAWMVFISAFYDKEALALETLRSIKAEYDKLSSLGAGAISKPAVVLNGPFSGTWTVPAGESYMARMLADAGAKYLWADTKGTGGISLSVEAVFEKALSASIWLQPSYAAMSLADVKALDPRFSALPALKNGQVWNNNLRLSPMGGNDYFESGFMQPQVVLADLIAILHPELMPGHKFFYYRKLQ